MTERRAYDAEVSELTLVASTLREDLRIKDESINEEREILKSENQSLKKEIASISNDLASLRAREASAPSQASVEKMKRELSILKRLEYNAEMEDNYNPEMTDQDLEAVLVSRLQKIESELVRERREKKELHDQANDFNENITELKQQIDQANTLIASLEQHLSEAITSSQSSKTTGTIAQPELGDSHSHTLNHILNSKSTDPSSTLSAPKSAPVKPPKAKDEMSVANIIMAQRDRLRARCDTLEAERDSFKRELQIQVGLAESLKTDNTKLYEKVRYLQNFQQGREQDRDLDLEALEERYEASVDPFRQFSKNERQRKLKQMSPMERMVFATAKFVLGSKQMRAGLFVYVMSLHFLVFVTTYHWSHEISYDDLNLNEGIAHLPPRDESVLDLSKSN